MIRRTALVIACLALLEGCATERRATSPAEPPAPARGATAAPPAAPATSAPLAAARVGFETDVRPLLEAKCGPCHFEGGKVHEKLPFDQPRTIRQLGTALFTRIKDEQDRALIRAFLAEE